MEQLGEKLLSKVTGITGIPGTEIVSKTTRDINGKNAVELVIHREGYHIFSVWMQKGQDIIRVSFQVSDDRYPVDKNSLVTATNSIKIN